MLVTNAGYEQQSGVSHIFNPSRIMLGAVGANFFTISQNFKLCMGAPLKNEDRVQIG